jgi:dCTP deaminase
MADTLQFALVSPERKLASMAATQVQIPGMGGDLTAMLDYDPLEFWEPIRFHTTSSLILDPDEFYIFMTREAIAVPPEYAAEMMPYDTRAGEFRVHYAGFFDPGFGWDVRTGRAGSSRGVLEVRSHEIPFLLEHGQTVGWLRYERMAARPDVLYGAGAMSNYQGQGLKLAKQFGQSAV